MTIKTPPMGWNTWNTFEMHINEQLIKETADIMVKSGLKDAGYNYVIIDDGWQLPERDKKGRLVPDPAKFPSGMKALADYIHGLGLKFGMYSSSGTLTCLGLPASLDHEFIDAETFASWDVDYLKYDFCYKPESLRAKDLYRRMGLALADSGRDILFAACSWGWEETAQWIRSANVHTWRSTGDIFDTFPSVKSLIEAQLPLLPYGGQGCFNDMDMLIVGMNGKGNVGLTGCTFEEYRLHFSAWALLASPLIIGCDVRNMTDETRKILLNRDVIALNQDTGGRQVFELTGNTDGPIFVRMLDNGDVALGIFNLTDKACNHSVLIDLLGLPQHTGKTLTFTDLWTGNRLTPNCGTLRVSLQPHDCMLLRGKLRNA